MKKINIIKKEYLLIISAILINFFLVFLTDYQCPWKASGIDCAGCGTTRMVKAIFRFEFYQAFRYNPLIFILLIIIILYVIYILICLLLKKRYVLPGRKTLIALAIIIIVYMVLRNIDIFDFLKPTEIN